MPDKQPEGSTEELTDSDEKGSVGRIDGSDTVTQNGASSLDIEALITAQLQVMHRQLDMLRDARFSDAVHPSALKLNATDTLNTADAANEAVVHSAVNDALMESLRQKQLTLLSAATATDHSPSTPPTSPTPGHSTAAYDAAGVSTLTNPPVANAVLGFTDNGEAAWFVVDPENPDVRHLVKDT